MDTACVVEAAATALLPGPVLPTVTAGAVALLADDTDTAQTLVGRLAEGAPGAVVIVRWPDSALRRPRRLDGQWKSAATLGVCSAQVILVAARPTTARSGSCSIRPRPPVLIDAPAGTDKTTDVGILRLDGYACPAALGADGHRRRAGAMLWRPH